MRQYTSTVLATLLLASAIATTGNIQSATASEPTFSHETTAVHVGIEARSRRQRRPGYRGSGRREIMRFLATEA